MKDESVDSTGSICKYNKLFNFSGCRKIKNHTRKDVVRIMNQYVVKYLLVPN